MAGLTDKQLEVAKLLVEALDLEDIDAEDINAEAPLFGFDSPDSLGLDSIDALEISLQVAKEYNVQIKADDENNKNIFYSLKNLTDHIIANS